MEPTSSQRGSQPNGLTPAVQNSMLNNTTDADFDSNPPRSSLQQAAMPGAHLANLDTNDQTSSTQRNASNQDMRSASSQSELPLSRPQSLGDLVGVDSNSPYQNFPSHLRALIADHQPSTPLVPIDLRQHAIPLEAIRFYEQKASSLSSDSTPNLRVTSALPDLQIPLSPLLQEAMAEPVHQAQCHLSALVQAARLRQGTVLFHEGEQALVPEALETKLHNIKAALSSLREVWAFCDSYYKQTGNCRDKEARTTFFNEHFTPFVDMFTRHDDAIFAQDNNSGRDNLFDPEVNNMRDRMNTDDEEVDIGVSGQLKSLNNFLTLLQKTEESTDPVTYAALVVRVHDVLRACHEDDQVLNEVVYLARSNQVNCVDRRTLIFGEMELPAFLHNHCKGKRTDEGLFDAGLRLMRLSVIDEHAIGHARRRYRNAAPPFNLRDEGTDESLEIALTYRVNLKDLGLPVGTSVMKYNHFLQQNPEDLNIVRRDVLQRTYDPKTVSEFFCNWSPWLKHLEKTDTHVIQAIRQSSFDQEDVLSERMGIGAQGKQDPKTALSTQEYLNKIEALKTCKEAKIKAVIQAESQYRIGELHANWLTEQPALDSNDAGSETDKHNGNANAGSQSSAAPSDTMDEDNDTSSTSSEATLDVTNTNTNPLALPPATDDYVDSDELAMLAARRNNGVQALLRQINDTEQSPPT